MTDISSGEMSTEPSDTDEREVGDIVTPCHGLPPMFHYTYEGYAYMQERVVDGLECPALGCYNTWTYEGKFDGH